MNFEEQKDTVLDIETVETDDCFFCCVIVGGSNDGGGKKKKENLK